MTEPFQATPDGLRSTSAQLGDVSGQMKDLLASLREKLSSQGAPWGDDELGDQFAKGAAGYLAQLQWVDGSVDAKTGLLDYYSSGLKEAADSFQQADEA